MTQDITALEELKISEEVEISRVFLYDEGHIQGIGKVASQTQSGIRSWVSKRTTRKKPEDGDSVSTIQYLSVLCFHFLLSLAI